MVKRARAFAAPFAAAFTAGVYALSSWAKWTDPAGFDASLGGYGFGPALRTFLAWVVPAGESALVVALLLAWIWQARRLLSGLLWAAAAGFAGFTAAMSWALARGLGQSGCGCFGGNAPLTAWDIARDVVFMAVAAFGAVAWRRAGRSTEPDGASPL